MIPSKFNRVPKSKGKKVIKNLDGIWSVVSRYQLGQFFLANQIYFLTIIALKFVFSIFYFCNLAQ